MLNAESKNIALILNSYIRVKTPIPLEQIKRQEMNIKRPKDSKNDRISYKNQTIDVHQRKPNKSIISKFSKSICALLLI